MRSLRARLWLLWLLTLLASLGVSALLVELYGTSSTAQLQRGEAVVARACGLVGERYAFYTAGSPASGPDLGQDLLPVVMAALAHQRGVEGGIWSAASGSLAYAFPTYEGSGPGIDLPAAELPSIRAANAEAAAADQLVLRRVVSRSGGSILAACPLPAAATGVTAWTMVRVQQAGSGRLRAGLALLGALVLLIAGGVTWLTTSWGRHVRRIETALQSHDIEDLPRLPETGERELDRVVAALNAAGERMATGRARAAELAARVAAAEHLASLGRVAAGIAHEIRNPMAALRLRAENALAGDADRLRPALEASLVQIARVDRLLAEMLAMTQRRAPQVREVDVPAFLDGVLAGQRDRARAADVALELDAPPARASFDAELLGRAVENLLLNALQHVPPGGRVTVSARHDADRLRIGVADTGPGVEPSLRTRLFEPFATGRADGTGLGLAIAREMVEAHGGRLHLAERAEAGALFVLELPLSASGPPAALAAALAAAR